MSESTSSAPVEFRFPPEGKSPPHGYEQAEPGGLAGRGTVDRDGVLTVVEAVPAYEKLVRWLVAELNGRERVMVKFGGSTKFSTAGRWFYRHHASFLTALKDYSLRSYGMALSFEESDLGAESYASLHPSDWPEFAPSRRPLEERLLAEVQPLPSGDLASPRADDPDASPGPEL